MLVLGADTQGDHRRVFQQDQCIRYCVRLPFCHQFILNCERVSVRDWMGKSDQVGVHAGSGGALDGVFCQCNQGLRVAWQGSDGLDGFLD